MALMCSGSDCGRTVIHEVGLGVKGGRPVPRSGTGMVGTRPVPGGSHGDN